MTRPAFGPIDIIPLFDNAVEDDGLLSFEISRADESFSQFPAEALTYWVVADGDNPVDGDDFTSVALPNGVIVFEEGDASQILHIGLAADSFPEGDETFSLVIAPGLSQSPSRITGSTDVVVLNDDEGDPDDLVEPIGPFVFMFVNEATGSNFFTADQGEAEFIEENVASFSAQGAAFQAAPEGNRWAADVFRFYNTDTGSHFYTANGAEKALIEENLDGFVYEGVVFQTFVDTVNDETVPVYRLFDGATGVHHFVTDAAERQGMIADGFADEGFAFYVDALIG
ncbi:MAG: hypothetical protein GVY13_00140 [Alphaproteobacteria bacterium]|jgi:hypothetical protein|nr:hypothetical protein [Alphaproteobacteria bacterium]